MIKSETVKVFCHQGKSFSAIDSLKDSRLLSLIRGDFNYCDEGISYYSAYHLHSYDINTVVVYYGSRPVMGMAATLKEGVLSFFHFPARIFYDDTEETAIIHKAAEAFYKWLTEWISLVKVTKALMLFDPFFTAKYFFNIRNITNTHYGIIDLRLSEQEIRGSLRKSYKSLVNWGAREMSIRIADQNNLVPADIETFKQFHIAVAGRKTRSDESWNAQFEAVRMGRGFITFGYLGENLVAVTFIQAGLTEAFYGVGVYDRKLMADGLPIAHYPLYSSILTAKKYGFHFFKIDGLDQTDGKTEKQNNIAFFKKGFVNAISLETHYEFNFPGDQLNTQQQ
jgi:hypothetical protein